MMRLLFAVLTGVAFAAFLPSRSTAIPTAKTWTAHLTASQVVPTRPSSSGTAVATLSFYAPNGEADITIVRYAHLSSPVTKIVVGYGARGTLGTLLRPLCERGSQVPCPSHFEIRTIYYPDARHYALRSQFFIEIMTTKHPGGELRGQFVAG